MRPCVLFVMICRHPPGLYADVDWISLVAMTILALGKCRRIVLVSPYLVCDWSIARLCSAMHMISVWILWRLSRTCLKLSYWWYALIPLMFVKYSLVIHFGFGIVVTSLIKSLSVLACRVCWCCCCCCCIGRFIAILVGIGAVWFGIEVWSVVGC